VRDDQPNESAILAQIDKVAQARAELEKANARYLLALRSKLTPEQWKQVQEFRENRGQMRGNWGDGGHGPVGPEAAGWTRWSRWTRNPMDEGRAEATLRMQRPHPRARRACSTMTVARKVQQSGRPRRRQSSVIGDSIQRFWQRATAVVVNTDGGMRRSSCRLFLVNRSDCNGKLH